MDCQRCLDDMTAFMDGELAGSAAEEMRDHLKKCPPCQAEYRDLKDSTAMVVEHVGELEPVPEIWNNLRNRIAEMPPPSRSLSPFHFLVVNRWAAAVTTVAATMALALGTWSYVQHQQAQSDLESSLSGYVRIRTITERYHSRQLTAADKPSFNMNYFGPNDMRNPFADIRPVSLTNPFKPEER